MMLEMESVHETGWMVDSRSDDIKTMYEKPVIVSVITDEILEDQ